VFDITEANIACSFRLKRNETNEGVPPMQRFVLLFAFALIGLGSGMASAGGPPDAVEIEKSYDQIGQAMADHNIEKFMSFFDSNVDIEVPQPGNSQPGKHTYTDHKGDIESLFKVSRKAVVTNTIKNVSVDGNKASVYLELKIRSEMLVSENWMPAIITRKFDDVWEKKNGTWKIVSSKLLTQNAEPDPKWKEDMEKASTAATPCNFSYNGCR
jgi:hypothetical protein